MENQVVEPRRLCTREDLYFKDYKWNIEYEPNDPRISGDLDDVFFCRKNGEEVIYIINQCAAKWNWTGGSVQSFQRLEKMIHFFLPKLISTQKNVVLWIELNWRKYWNML